MKEDGMTDADSNYLVYDATHRGEAEAYQLSAKREVRAAIETDLAAGGERAAIVCRAEWDRLHGRLPTGLTETDFPRWQEHWLTAFRARMAAPLSAAERKARDLAEHQEQARLDRAIFLGQVDD